ncbi:MAG: hypothetical protein R3F56_00810 [Planctomycetota bacterium]
MRIPALTASCLLLAALPGQVPAADGPLVGMPLAFGVDATSTLGAAPSRGAEHFLKPAGFTTAVPAPLPGVAIDFSPSAVLGAAMTAPYPDLDAVSHGLDVIPADSAGVVTVPPGHWNFLTFSVRRGAVGDVGSAIRAEVGTPGGNEADFFEYVFRDSTCIPPEFIDRTFKLADSHDYGMPSGNEVDAVDLAMNLYPLAAALPPTLGLPACPTACPTLYFSLEGSAANLALWPAALWGGHTPSGAMVFKSTWSAGAWGPPTIAFTPAQLDLGDCEDIDGLAVDAYDPGGMQVLYSTTRTGCTQRDELMFKGCPCDLPAAPLRYRDGTPVSTRLGLGGGDEVDAICVGDPLCQGTRNNQPGILQLERTVGDPWPASTTFGFPRELAVQALREPLPPSLGFAYRLLLVNGHPGGFGALLVSLPTLYPFVFPTQLPLQVPFTSPFPGQPVSLSVQLPPEMLGAELIVQGATVPPLPPFDVHLSHALRFAAR